MKNLLLVFTLLMTMACCTTEASREMDALLDRADSMNRAYVPMTDGIDSLLLEATRYYDRHGDANQQMRAHYLLGCAYRDMGEAPAALQSYQDAIDRADTLSNDCDFAQLSRVYAQMAFVFYAQGLYREQLQNTMFSVNYAWRAGDIFLALTNYEQESFAYNNLGLQDSAIIIIEDVVGKYNQYGYSVNAAIAFGTILRILIDREEYQKAKSHMDIYESKSGLFDASGNIEHGREVYYNIKGFYYLYINNLDSAEYYFRKELREGKDYNNQHAGAKGLSELYQLLNIPDSMAKYYRYAYVMNDSVYTQKTAKEIKRMQAMYDYTRHQEIARKKSEEARQNKEELRLIFTLFIGLVFTIIILSYRFIRKRREGLVLYMQSLKELKQLRSEKVALSQYQEEFFQIIQEKDKKIDYLEERVKKYGKQVYFKTANAERCLRESPVYKNLEKKAIHGQFLVEEDWKKIKILIGEYLPSFDDFLATNLHRLKGSEYQVMILLRLHFKPVDIAGMIDLSKSQISQNCTEIMKKIFESKGSSKELSVKLDKIF
ncbi:MAG: hypothetical protein K6E67_08800 [Prevotella sp.]|nr:hypothetical protein [Prevotella sp.]